MRQHQLMTDTLIPFARRFIVEMEFRAWSVMAHRLIINSETPYHATASRRNTTSHPVRSR